MCAIDICKLYLHFIKNKNIGEGLCVKFRTQVILDRGGRGINESSALPVILYSLKRKRSIEK